MMKTKTKAPTYHYKLAASFDTLQQYVAQYPLCIFQQADQFWFWLIYEEWVVHDWPCDDIPV